jgi:hypothetical protein
MRSHRYAYPRVTSIEARADTTPQSATTSATASLPAPASQASSKKELRG